MSAIANGQRGTRQYPQAGNGSKGEVARGGKRSKLLGPRPDWMGSPERRCEDKPTRWWYAPEEEDGHGKLTAKELVAAKADAARATALCDACPLELECAEWGLTHERWGIWGGVRLTGLNANTRRDRLNRVQRDLQRRRSA